MFSRKLLPATLVFLSLAIGSIGAVPAVARAQRSVGPAPLRLAFADGEVSFWRPGAEDWTPAQVNTALAAGDSLYVDNGANLEVEIGPRAFVRAGSETYLGIESIETGYLQIKVTQGHVAIDLKRLREGERVEVDTPNGAFIIDQAGYYRVDVDDSTTFATHRGGPATVIPVGGEETEIQESRQVVIEGTVTASVTTNRAPEPDQWDGWNYDRTAQLGKRPRSAQYVSPDVAGIDDLDRYGRWRETRRYGHVWVPDYAPADWAPYSTGRWVWDPYYGWTWVDYAPWGWAPYHYGRWCWVDGFWGWAPGPVFVAPVYAPALVAFFGPRVGVSVDVGIGFPFVSWVALGFGEPIIPWWGPAGFIGRPFWGGWGGPRIVNNVVINNTRIVNVTNITKYRNMNVNHALVAVDRDRFGRGAVKRARFKAEHRQHLQPVRGRLGVKPVAASLVPGTGHARRPPDRIGKRQVVATRPPKDPARWLKAAGLAPNWVVEPVKPRILGPRVGRQSGPGQGANWDRDTPPAPAPQRRGGAARGTQDQQAARPPWPGGNRDRVKRGTKGPPAKLGESRARPRERSIERGTPPPETGRHGTAGAPPFERRMQGKPENGHPLRLPAETRRRPAVGPPKLATEPSKPPPWRSLEPPLAEGRSGLAPSPPRSSMGHGSSASAPSFTPRSSLPSRPGFSKRRGVPAARSGD